LSHINDYRTDPTIAGVRPGSLAFWCYSSRQLLSTFGRHQYRWLEYFVTAFDGLLGPAPFKWASPVCNNSGSERLES